MLALAFGARGDVVELVTSTKEFGAVSALAFTPGGSLLAVAGSRGTVHLLDPATGREKRRLILASGRVDALAFNRTGKRLAGGINNAFLVWDTVSGEVLHNVRARMGRVVAVAYSPRDSFLVTSGTDHYLRVFDTKTYEHLRALPAGGVTATSIAFAGDGSLVAACGSRVLVWGPGLEGDPRRINGDPAAIMALIKGGEQVVGADRKGALVVRNMKTGREEARQVQHKGRVLGLSVSRNRELLASSGQDRKIVLWHGDNVEALHAIRDLEREAVAIAVGPKAGYLAAGLRTPGSRLLLWKLDAPALYAGDGMVDAPDVDADYLTRLEQAVVAEQNLARTNPGEYAKFARRHRARFQDKVYRSEDGRNITTQEGTAAVDEAIKFLEKVKPVKPLGPSAGMSLAARDHVLDTGPRGITGHDGTDGSQPAERINRHGQWLNTSGENISYGVRDARAIVLQLIIDDGVPGRGHRANIYNGSFRKTGVNVGAHKQYGSMCVITYAGGYKEK